MFEITYKDLRNKDFLSGINKLTSHTGYKAFKTAYNVSRIGANLRETAKEAEEVFLKLVKAHGKVEGMSFEIPEENREAWGVAVKEYMDHKLTINRHRVNIQDVDGVGFSPSEIDALTPLLDGLDTL